MEEPARKGDWLRTITGKQFYPCDPRPEEVCIEDIAHGLSMICRFNGHLPVFYSVAQHSLACSHIVPPENALWALLHDASEAYIGDLIRPMKRVPVLGTEYKKIEAQIMVVICTRFGLSMPMPEKVVWADNVLLATEKRQFFNGKFGDKKHFADEDYEPLDVHISPMPPEIVVNEFMWRFKELTK